MWWSCHLMRCDCLCCVMSRDAMRCHVMCAHVMCPAMVTLCVRSGSVTSLYYKVLLQYYSVLQSTTPVLLCTTQYYNVLLQYYSVLQSTTPVLPCTTKYYSSTTLYCKVLLQYYSVLQSTTPVLLCTAKYYSSTTLYYKVLLQYYSVLHSTTTYYSSTTLYYKVIDVRRIWNVIYNARSNRSHPPTSPNTAPATQNDCDDWSASHMKRHLQCAEQQASPSNLTKYCACHVKRISSLIRVTYETSFTMRGATSIALQRHQILRLPHKKSLVFDPPHIWNVIYNARSNRHRPPTSPNTAPATQNDSHDWSSSHMERHLQCAEQQASPCNLTKYCTCHAKWLSWLMSVTYESSFTMRGATGIALQPHQILRLPRKMTLMIDLRHIWNVIYNARSNKHHPPTSPNTAPATQNDSHDWCPSHMKRHLQCAEQQASPSNLTKYCACHAKLHSKILEKLSENSWSVIYNARPIRAWSEHDPSMIRPWTRHLAPARSRRLHFVLRRRILYWKLQHFALRLSTQISPNTAPATKSDTPRSPNTAPATKNDSHDWYPWHMKRHLQCAEQQASPCNLTKYCACHAKWLSWLIFVTYGTSFTMRGATGITLQPHQILRLPRKSALQNLSEILRERLKRQFQCAADSTMIRAWSEHDPTMNSSSRTRPFAEVTFRASETHFVLKITTFRAPAIYSNFTEYCACHEKWHSDITKYCACHEKWHSDITKCCACHEKWHSDITKYCACHEKWDCYWTVTELSCYWAVTKLLLSCYWTVTELILDCHWTVTALTCYWAVTELSCYWTVTELNCYWTVTQLLLNWPVTELLLNWAVTQLLLDCYWTDLLLSCYWTVTELSCY